MKTIAVWMLRVVLVGAAILKLSELDQRLGVLGWGVAVIELGAVGLTFWPPWFRDLGVIAVLWGFVGAGLVTAVSIVLDPALGQAPCGCLGSLIELRRDEALVLQGLVIVLASLAARGAGQAHHSLTLE